MFVKKNLFFDKEKFLNSCKKRNHTVEFEEFENLYSQLKLLNTEYDVLKNQQKKNHQENEESKKIKIKILEINSKTQKIEEELNNWLLNQPNILLEEVPYGLSEKDNKVVFETQHDCLHTNISHDVIISNLIMHNESSNISGSRFVVFKDKLSDLKNALIKFMINNNKKFGFQEYSIPYLVKTDSLFNTGQYPKFKEEAFSTQNDKWLISTGEVPLVNIWRNYLFEKNESAKLCMTYSPCFRKEAGSAGKDMKGLVRLHQFHKVELVTICKQEEAEEMHLNQLEAAKDILNQLNLNYRVLLLCGYDTGFTASKQYDLEVWMPGMNKYLEIASCSQCGTFQSVRANIKYKTDGKNEYCATLNGSSLPIERLIAAIAENYYNKQENKINIPDVLKEIIGYDYIDCK